jgi:catechol 2,3-dioxygenase-like lactoylglutathione lyase family enzyme
MELVDGISHVATVTDDLDRMVTFYRRVFNAEASAVMEEDGLRHQLIFLGDKVALHPFELSWAQPDQRFEMFDRGRLDHFGVTAPSVDALLEIRDRLLAEDDGAGATDAQIRDFGALYSLHFVDPDGVHLEVNLFKDDWTELEMLKREAWTVVDLEPAVGGT